MSPQDELVDLLARLVGLLTPEDLSDDPELSGMVSQVIQILEPKSAPLPLQVMEKLNGIDNRIDRFKAAVELLAANDPMKLKQVADSLRDAGLLKTDGDSNQ